MPEFRSGTVTFLFTDIERSTSLARELGDAFAELLSEHNQLLRSAFASGGGSEMGTQGDALFFVFPRAHDAVLAALAGQRKLAEHRWPRDAVVRVRMALHTGEPTITESGYVGLDLHRVARIAAAGHGGQILLSHSTRNLVCDLLPAGVSLRDLGEHRLKDFDQPLRIYQLVAAGLPVDFPLLRSAAAAVSNLPRQLSSFVGREHEVAEVRLALAKARLVTLTGMGGSGKSRLALQAASDMAADFPDGVRLAEFAALMDPALVTQVIASAVGVREQPGRPLLATVSEYLGSKSLLLLADNCEHLLDECGRVVEAILRACPDLRVLATSREALRISGEQVYKVPPLSLPDLGHAPSPDELMRSEAARLFVERAELAKPSFSITPENALHIAQLCQQLEGIPLAIELAAARVKILSVGQILERLKDRFRILSGGSRMALPRHQALRASMDWSFGLLTEPEKMLLRRLSVFAGGCTIEAVEAVCVASPAGESDPLGLLDHLVDKSLVMVDHQSDAARYRLHEIVRQYARERLDEAGEAEPTHARHRDCFLAMAERAEPELQGSSQPAWLDRLEADHDNLRSAFEYTRSHGDIDTAMRMACALWRFWEVRGYLTEGREWLKYALSGRSGVSPEVLARALDGDGRLAWRQGDYKGAHDRFEESLGLWQSIGDKAGEANAFNGLARAAVNLGDLVRAKSWAQQSMALQRELGNQSGVATAMNTLGEVARAEGDFPNAAACYERSLATFREIGDIAAAVSMLHNLGYAALAQGAEDRAETCFGEALRIARDLKDQMGICHMLAGLAGVAVARGEPRRAAQLLGAAEQARVAGGYVRERVDQAAVDRDLAMTRAALDEATFQAEWTRGRSVFLEDAVKMALREAGASVGSLSEL